jgi:hypothetical protein
MHVRTPAILLFALLSLPASEAATRITGRVFYDKLDPKAPSFFFHSSDATKDGQRRVLSIYTDKDGKELVREENTFEAGKLIKSVYKQSQVNESGEVSIKDGKVNFTFNDHNGTETDSEDVEPNMVLGSMIGDHVLQNWDELMKGETIYVRYMAIERCDTIGFKFFKDKERTVDGKTLVDFKMKPSSFIIAALVDPIRLTVTKDPPRRIAEVEGRTPIRWPRKEPPQKRDDWKAIDARIEFDAPIEVPEEAPKEAPKENKEAPKELPKEKAPEKAPAK